MGTGLLWILKITIAVGTVLLTASAAGRQLAVG